MFSDVDRVIRAAVAHEREIQRDIADKQAEHGPGISSGAAPLDIPPAVAVSPPEPAGSPGP